MKDMSYEFIHKYDPVTGHEANVDEFHCPCCQSGHIDHVDTDFECSEMVIMAHKCRDCGTEFEVHYVFDGVYVNKDGRFNN